MRTYVRLGLLLAVLAVAVLAGGGTPAYAWSYPAALNSNAATDSGNDWDPQVTTDGAGNWVAVWVGSDDLGGTIDTDRDILVARSTDNGGTWTAPAALNTNAATDSGDDYLPQVTTDGVGNWVAVWDSSENLSGSIGEELDILVSRSTDNGASWTPPAALNSNAATDGGYDQHPQVTTDGSGNWVAVWGSNDTLGSTIENDWDILVARSTDNGATWTAPAALNTNADTDSGWDTRPQVTTDGGGNWVAAWESNENLAGGIGEDFDILVARSTDNGASWTYPAALHTNAPTTWGADSFPQVTTDGGGNWVAVWQSGDSLGGSIGEDYDILVSRSTDNGASWTDASALNTNAASDSIPDNFPQMTTNGTGYWRAVWKSALADQDISESHSTDNGDTWTAPALLNSNGSTDSGNDDHPQVTTDGGGNWVAVWSSNDTLGGPLWLDGDILYATEYIPPYPPVGGLAELPDAAGSSGPNYALLAGLAAAALVALGAGGWYARRRWQG